MDLVSCETGMHNDERAMVKDTPLSVGELLDAAVAGRPALVRHQSVTVALVDAERLRQLLAVQLVGRATLVAEAGGWSVFLPGTPVGVAGDTYEAALTEMVDALRAYSSQWQARLGRAPTRDDWALVQLVSLSSDEQLRLWLNSDEP